MILSIDAMGGDDAPQAIVTGLAIHARAADDARFLVHGTESEVAPLLEREPALAGRFEFEPADGVVAATDKPSQALRRGRGSSMWNAIEAVKTGEAAAAVSAGNTGALMAISMLSLRKMQGVHRPAMTAIWPTLKGRSVVLDVGANLEADAEQLLSFAIMGEAYARALTGKDKPSLGLLNIGAEEVKGHEEIRRAAELIKSCGLGLDYVGFVEGDDISAGSADVVVTDGFTGNVALKTAEGTARLVASYVRDALTATTLTKAGALLAKDGLRRLKARMDPSNVNGGVLLGLNGLVVKSHGGATPEGFATALSLAERLAGSGYSQEVAASLSRLARPEPAAAGSETAA